MNPHAKFDVSSSNRSRDMEGVPKFKSRSGDPIPDNLLRNFAFLSLIPLMLNLLAKFDVSSSNRFRDMEGVPKLQK